MCRNELSKITMPWYISKERCKLLQKKQWDVWQTEPLKREESAGRRSQTPDWRMSERLKSAENKWERRKSGKSAIREKRCLRMSMKNSRMGNKQQTRAVLLVYSEAAFVPSDSERTFWMELFALKSLLNLLMIPLNFPHNSRFVILI